MLSLFTKTPPIIIEIDGKPYDVLHPDALPLNKIRSVETGVPRLSHLLTVATPTPEQDAEAGTLLAQLTIDVLHAPAEITERLNDSQRLAVLELFMKARVRDADEGAAAPMPRRRTSKRNS